jgi:2-iminobutanoate/2-iminopropanoate deaminase
MSEAVKTSNAPAAIGPYSQGIKAGNLIFTSGQIPVNPSDGTIADTVNEQARQAFENVSAVLKAAGGRLDKVVKTTIFITNMDDFAAINKVYAEFFGEPFPARSCVEVSRLPKGVILEVEAIVVCES